MTLYELNVLDNRNQSVSLADHRGKVLLIVNTATQCGFTPQYAGLQSMYTRFQPQGFEILDFPCDQFAHQAPGTSEEIAFFCETRFGVTFPQFAKIDVNGANESPLYTFLKSQKSGVFGGRIKWNFTKFLVDANGAVAARYAPTTTPETIAASIENLLRRPNAQP